MTAVFTVLTIQRARRTDPTTAANVQKAMKEKTANLLVSICLTFTSTLSVHSTSFSDKVPGSHVVPLGNIIYTEF